MDRKYTSKHKLETMTCEVCGLEKNSLRQHVTRSHKEYTWESYCKEFNHDPSKGRLMPEAQKKLLSKNKAKFYAETERGKELREEQSKEWSKNNPASKPKNREKLDRMAQAAGYTGASTFLDEWIENHD